MERLRGFSRIAGSVLVLLGVADLVDGFRKLLGFIASLTLMTASVVLDRRWKKAPAP